MSTFPTKQVTLRDGAQVVLRSPTEADAEQLIAYLDQVRRETPFLMFDPLDELPTLESERVWVRQSIERPRAVKIAAEAEGRIIALCDVTAGSMIRNRHRGEMGISVLADYCNRGLGTLLMGELVGWSREQEGVVLLRLSVTAGNERAIAVYRKIGFEIEGTRRHAIRFIDGSYRDEHVMSLWLGEAQSLSDEEHGP